MAFAQELARARDTLQMELGELHVAFDRGAADTARNKREKSALQHDVMAARVDTKEQLQVHG